MERHAKIVGDFVGGEFAPLQGAENALPGGFGVFGLCFAIRKTAMAVRPNSRDDMELRVWFEYQKLQRHSGRRRNRRLRNERSKADVGFNRTIGFKDKHRKSPFSGDRKGALLC